MVAISGQRRLMFCSATWRLRALKEFDASTNSIASASLDSKADLAACIVASSTRDLASTQLATACCFLNISGNNC